MDAAINEVVEKALCLMPMLSIQEIAFPNRQFAAVAAEVLETAVNRTTRTVFDDLIFGCIDYNGSKQNSAPDNAKDIAGHHNICRPLWGIGRAIANGRFGVEQE